jgi:hypothetical protein
MIVYVLFVHKQSVSKRKVCIIFIKIKIKKKKHSGFFGLFWVGFLWLTLIVMDKTSGVLLLQDIEYMTYNLSYNSSDVELAVYPRLHENT